MGASNLLFDDLGDANVSVCYEGVKVQPPQPIPLILLNQSLHHVVLVPCRASVGVGFVVDDKVQAMAACEI